MMNQTYKVEKLNLATHGTEVSSEIGLILVKQMIEQEKLQKAANLIPEVEKPVKEDLQPMLFKQKKVVAKKEYVNAFDDLVEEEKKEEQEEKTNEQVKREGELYFSRTRALLKQEKHDMSVSEYTAQLALKDVKPLNP